MQTEYIILDSNNNWLSTTTTKEEALAEYKAIKDGQGDVYDMEVGDELWLYEAKCIKSDKI